MLPLHVMPTATLVQQSQMHRASMRKKTQYLVEMVI